MEWSNFHPLLAAYDVVAVDAVVSGERHRVENLASHGADVLELKHGIIHDLHLHIVPTVSADYLGTGEIGG